MICSVDRREKCFNVSVREFEELQLRLKVEQLQQPHL